MSIKYLNGEGGTEQDFKTACSNSSRFRLSALWGHPFVFPSFVRWVSLRVAEDDGFTSDVGSSCCKMLSQQQQVPYEKKMEEAKTKYIGAEKNAALPLPPAMAGRARSRGPRPAPLPRATPRGGAPRSPRPRGTCRAGLPPPRSGGRGLQAAAPGRGARPLPGDFLLGSGSRSTSLLTFQSATSRLRE